MEHARQGAAPRAWPRRRRSSSPCSSPGSSLGRLRGRWPTRARPAPQRQRVWETGVSSGGASVSLSLCRTSIRAPGSGSKLGAKVVHTFALKSGRRAPFCFPPLPKVAARDRLVARLASSRTLASVAPMLVQHIGRFRPTLCHEIGQLLPFDLRPSPPVDVARTLDRARPRRVPQGRGGGRRLGRLPPVPGIEAARGGVCGVLRLGLFVLLDLELGASACRLRGRGPGEGVEWGGPRSGKGPLRAQRRPGDMAPRAVLPGGDQGCTWPHKVDT